MKAVIALITFALGLFAGEVLMLTLVYTQEPPEPK